VSNDIKYVLKGLLKAFDGNSSFMTGHQIIRTRTESRKRKTPAWALDDAFVRDLLLKSFPMLATSSVQRKRAGRWLMVINRYFKSLNSYREVAEEMGESKNAVRFVIRNIYLAVDGKKANGSGKRGGWARNGRPKK
jgi:hypothetical protein